MQNRTHLHYIPTELRKNKPFSTIIVYWLKNKELFQKADQLYCFLGSSHSKVPVLSYRNETQQEVDLLCAVKHCSVRLCHPDPPVHLRAVLSCIDAGHRAANDHPGG